LRATTGSAREPGETEDRAAAAARLLEARQVALFCGAGISQDPPAGLPDWHDLRDLTIAAVASRDPVAAGYVTRLTAVDMLAQPGKRGMTPELVASVLADATPAYFESLRALHDGEPNANHDCIAELAARGHLQHVVTTNFDGFIERAFERRAVPLRVVRTDEEFAAFAPDADGIQLLKIHGCITMPSTITATVEQEGAGLRPPIRAALEHLLISRWLLFWGYSGADLKIDLDYLGMVSAADRARGFFWSCFRSADFEETPHPLVVELAGIYGARAIVAPGLAPDAIAGVLPAAARSQAPALAGEDKVRWQQAKHARLAATLDAWATTSASAQLACRAVGSLLNVEGAQADAITCFRRMRELAHDAGSGAEVCRALVLSASAFRNNGQLVEAYADLKAAEEQADALDAWQPRYTVLAELGSLYEAWGRHTDALNAWREAESLARQATAGADDAEDLVPLDLREGLARAYLRLGYNKPFLEQLAFIERVLRQTGDKRGLARILNLKMVSELEFGEWTEALATGREWQTLLRALGYRREMRFALVNLAAARMRTDGADAARADLDEAIALTGDEPSPGLELSIAMMSAALDAKEGRRSEARESLEKAIALAHALHDDHQAALALSSYASLTEGLDLAVSDRLDLMETAVGLLERCGDAQRAAQTAEEMGDVQASAAGLENDAVRSYRRAMANWRLRHVPDRMPALQEKLQLAASRATQTPLATTLELLTDAGSDPEVHDLLMEDARARVGAEPASLEALAASLDQEFGAVAGSTLMQRLHNAGEWTREDGQPRLAARYHAAAYRLALRIFDVQSAGVECNELALLAVSEKGYVAAKQLYERSLALAREGGNRREIVTAAANLGTLAQRQGRLDDAVTILEQAVAAAAANQLLLEECLLARRIGLIRRDQRRFPEARDWLERADAGLRQLGETRELADVLVGLGKTYRELQEPERSVRARLEAACLLEADGRRAEAAPFYLLAGNSLIKDLQRPADARPHLEKALTVFEGAQAVDQAAQARALLTQCNGA
jgi:tetratricopeptide (TPR) repeat protein